MVKPLLVETFNDFHSISSSQGALNVLLYFDIFHHPLTKEEIHQYLHYKPAQFDETVKSLEQLVEDGLIQESNNHFFLASAPSKIVERRKKGEQESQKGIRIARKYTKIIAAFPFVQAVFISGSLSKGYMDKESDIDYFIVTAPRRLWLTRTLLVLFKKIFLLNSRKNFCLNYFVAADNLEIPDRNIFTATELVSVIPTFNYTEYKRFLEKNSWSLNFLPNASRRDSHNCIKPRLLFAKKLFEKFFRGWIGELLDTFCFRLTLKFWERKFSHFNKNDFDNRLRSKKNVSKHHPLGYQFKVLHQFNEKVKMYELKNGIKLS
jgi:hypothetical protein